MTTEEAISTEDVALALGCAVKSGEDGRGFCLCPGIPHRGVGGWLPPYLEDSPEGYATLRELVAECKTRGWRWFVECDPTINYYQAFVYRSARSVEIASAHAETEVKARWTAFVRAVRATAEG